MEIGFVFLFNSILLGVGLAMDAFSVSLANGLNEPYMKKSRFLVISSYTEGLPVISMEALSLGVPVVSTIPSIGEVFGEETCGVVSENDNASLEEAIRRMLCDEAFYAQAKAGAEKRSAFFDGKRMVQQIEELFLELAGK